MVAQVQVTGRHHNGYKLKRYSPLLFLCIFALESSFLYKNYDNLYKSIYFVDISIYNKDINNIGVLVMTETKPKLIHFPSHMIDFIETYMKENDIKTFSSAVRELLNKQLADEYILETDEDIDEISQLYNHASNDEEKYQIKELIEVFKNYFKGRRVYKDLIRNYYKSQYMTLYEYIASNLNPSNAEKLMDMFKNQFYIAFGKIISSQPICHYAINIKFSNQSDNGFYDDMVKFLETEDFMHLDRFIKSKGLNGTMAEIKSRIRMFDTDAEKQYNDVVQSYYEYLHNVTSVYQFASKISQFLEGVKYD